MKWEIVRKNDCTILKFPIDKRLESASGHHTMLFGVQSLDKGYWTNRNAQGDLSKFLHFEGLSWNKIAAEFTKILTKNGFNAYGMECQCRNKLPFIVCLNNNSLFWDDPDVWKKDMQLMIKVLSAKLQNNPLCVGVFLDNEFFWKHKSLPIGEDMWLERHSFFVNTLVEAVLATNPNWLIFSNKYAAPLDNSLGTSHSWMNEDLFLEALLQNVLAGVDVVCINEYSPNPDVSQLIGLRHKRIEEFLQQKTGKFTPVFLSETGVQANRYERERAKKDGFFVAGRYSSKDFPQAENQKARAFHILSILKSVVENGGLGYFMHAAVDLGPVDNIFKFLFWKKWRDYSNWGIYDPWRNILYEDFLEIISEVHEQILLKREKQIGIKLWRSESL